jgi:hypothetical protein
MKSLITLFALVFSCSPLLAQKKWEFGYVANVGYAGLMKREAWEKEDKGRVKTRPGLSYSLGIAGAYRFSPKVSLEMSLQYNSFSFQKQNRSAHGFGFRQVEAQSIHIDRLLMPVNLQFRLSENGRHAFYIGTVSAYNFYFYYLEETYQKVGGKKKDVNYLGALSKEEGAKLDKTVELLFNLGLSLRPCKFWQIGLDAYAPAYSNSIIIRDYADFIGFYGAGQRFSNFSLSLRSVFWLK